MKNISFDNPYLLLIFIPIAIAIIVPFIISISRDNGNFGWKISLGIHLAIAALVTLAVAGLMSVTVLTKTTVYVVADVSYSSEKNLDKIDEYIRDIEESLPPNSELGVVCFGNDCVILTSAGRTLRSVSEARVDNTATNIASALNFTSELFTEGRIKRIVLITDGNDTVNKDVGTVASAVEQLKDKDIKIDAIFLDNTLTEDDREIQLSTVEASRSTFLGHDSAAQLILQSASEANVMLELYSKRTGELDESFVKINYTVISAEPGLNVITLPLPTNESGDFDYKVVATTEDDLSLYNNEQTFSQSVVGKLQVLLITGTAEDVTTLTQTYAGRADVHPCVVNSSHTDVPFTVEALAKYDEIVLSNVDVMNINNVNAFVDSIDKVVSQYGKSLVAIGNLGIQNSDTPSLKNLEELLPLKYGNANADGRLYTFIMDISHSMFMASRLFAAKEAAIKLISVLEDDDYVCLVTFSGEVMVNRLPTKLSECRQDLINQIYDLETGQGTYLGQGLKSALDAMESLPVSEKQVMLISDGKSFTNEPENAVAVSTDLNRAGITVSTINAVNLYDTKSCTLLKNIASAGGGYYYEMKNPDNVEDLVFGSVAEDMTNAVITANSAVTVARPKDDAVHGISSLPNILGFVQSVAKYDATVPVTVKYVKPNGYAMNLPLYAYREHGNGRIAAFTSSLSGDWTSMWTQESKEALAKNILATCAPEERVDYPFAVKLEPGTHQTYIEIIPGVLDPYATTTIMVTYPDGKTITRELLFDSQKYFYTFASSKIGSYTITVSYSYEGINEPFVAKTGFDIPYLPEYDAFANFDKSNVYEIIRGNGTITEGEIPSLENDEGEVATHKISYRVPLLIAAVALFIIDIIVRKLKWNDFNSFFEKIRRRKGERAQ